MEKKKENTLLLKQSSEETKKMICHNCKGKMEKIFGEMPKEKVEYEAYKCISCGEEILTMDQMKNLADKYKELRKAKKTFFAKWGNSIAIRIPDAIVKEYNLKPGKKAELRNEKGMIKIIVA